MSTIAARMMKGPRRKPRARTVHHSTIGKKFDPILPTDNVHVGYDMGIDDHSVTLLVQRGDTLHVVERTRGDSLSFKSGPAWGEE